MKKEITKISELVEFVSSIETPNALFFRGEKRDYKDTALFPIIYRESYIENEEVIYRESQRFNDGIFSQDKTTFDKISRIQHYSAPTRLIDVSEDLLSSTYFSIAEKDDDDDDAIVYIFEIDKAKIKYYDSDSVSVISNLAKIPLNSNNEKSKKQIQEDALRYFYDIEGFNKTKSAGYLLHEIREDKPHFSAIIDPKHIFSVQFVLPKLSSNRIKSQKGAFLLFGLNRCHIERPIKIVDYENLSCKIEHPIKKIHIAILKKCHIKSMKKELSNLGIKKSFIYPEIDKVSEFLKDQFKNA